MIAQIFNRILDFGIQASWVVLALVLLRLILRKCPRSIICGLWALVAVRLIFPFDIQSIFSLAPRSSDIIRPVDHYTTEAVRRAFPQIDETPMITAGGIQSGITTDTGDTLSAHLYYIAGIIWLVGVGAMLIYAIISYLRLWRMTRESIKAEDGTYLCDRIASPFILGVVRPKIFLPSDLSDHDKPYVLAHERAHIKRRDYLWKPIGFLLLAIYWFNPLLWLAYILLCKDIELACDEKVIRELGYEVKKPYAIALMNASVPRRFIAACPLAFGETSVKSRIKNVLSYKKPAFWIIIVAVVLSIVIAVCFLTNPIEKQDEPDTATPDSAIPNSAFTGVSAEYVWSSFSKDSTYAYVNLRIINDSDQGIAINMSDFRLYKNGELLSPSGGDATLYYDYFDAGKTGTSAFSLNPYLDKLDTESTFRIEADCFGYEKYSVNDTDGEYEPKKLKTSFDPITMDFKFPNKEERGDVPLYVTDIVYNDIDGDGEEEMLVLSPGPTSGIYSISVGAYDKDTHKEKYQSNFMSFLYSPYPDENMLTVIDGQAVIVTYDFNTDNPEGKPDRVVYAIKATDKQLYCKEIDREWSEVDISDLEHLTVSSDMPSLKYVDDKIAVFDGDCGMVVYSFEEKKVTDRLSLDTLRGMNYSIPYINVTADGKEIYIFDHADDLEESVERYKYIVYSPEEHMITAYTSHESWPSFERFSFNDQRYDVEYDDEIGNVSVRTYRKGNPQTGTQYELTVPGWKIKEMQLTVIDDKSRKTYDIFK